MTGKSEELTDFQRWVMTATGKGAGIDASPGAMTPKERLECEALVDRGMLERVKNHSADKHGMFVRPNDQGNGQAAPQSGKGANDGNN